jgi:cobalt/nickel transport system permease protein
MNQRNNMSHLHIPDGVIPGVWLLLGYLLTALFLGLTIRQASGGDAARRIPRLGVVAALMLVGMTVEIGIIGYHVNLTVLSGILLGPSLGFIAAFIVNIILALFGHGGITVVGLNTLVIGSETVLGSFIFRLLRQRLDARWAATITVFLTLALSTTLMIGIVALTRTEPGLVFHGPTGNEPAPLLSFELLSGDEEHNPMASLDLTRFAGLVYTLGAIGWIIEAAFTALVVGFLARTRRDLITGELQHTSVKGRQVGTGSS